MAGLVPAISIRPAWHCQTIGMPSTRPGMTCSSMNLRLRGRCGAAEKIEVAALVGLADVLRIHRAVAALKMRRRLFPGGAAARQFFVADVQVDLARGDIDFDLVAGLNQRQRTADI